MTFPFADVRFRLVALDGVNVPELPESRQPHLVLDAKGGRAAGSGGCNRFTGTYELEGERLSFGPLSAGRKTCPNGRYVESAFLKALEETARYRLEGDALALLAADGRLVATLTRKG